MLLICLKINKEALLAYLQLISYLQSTQSAQFGVNDRSAYQLTEGKLESITYKSDLKACDRRELFIFIGTLVLKAHYERKKSYLEINCNTYVHFQSKEMHLRQREMVYRQSIEILKVKLKPQAEVVATISIGCNVFIAWSFQQ